MATIGVDKLYYSIITEDENGIETYGTPKKLAKAMEIDLSIEIVEATLYADDSAAETVREFSSGTITLNVDALSAEVLADLTGARIDSNGVLISSGEDVGRYVAIAYRAKASKGQYYYFWIYRVKFAIPSENYKSKGDSIEFNTPTIEGTISQRHKEDSDGKHNWKAQVEENDKNKSIIEKWHDEVYKTPASTESTASTMSLSKGD